MRWFLLYSEILFISLLVDASDSCDWSLRAASYASAWFIMASRVLRLSVLANMSVCRALLCKPLMS